MASAIRIENFLKLAAVDSAAAAATTAAATEVNINATAATVATNHAKVTVTESASIFVSTEHISESNDDRQKKLISIPRSSYYYIDPLSPVLTDIEMTLRCGELVIIAGPVGAGKSTLLSVLLGEMKRCESSDENKGNTDSHNMQKACSESLLASSQSCPSLPSLPLYPSVCSRMAYCAQRPWIVAASVHTNITLAGIYTSVIFFQLHRFVPLQLYCYMTLFVINFPLCHSMSGKSICNKNESENSSETEGIQRSKIFPTIDEDLYSLAMESTQVVADLLNWPDYDDTEIGEVDILLDGRWISLNS